MVFPFKVINSYSNFMGINLLNGGKEILRIELWASRTNF